MSNTIVKRSEFECPICLSGDKFNIWCHKGSIHYLCQSCWNRIMQEGNPTCPLCREPLTDLNAERTITLVAPDQNLFLDVTNRPSTPLPEYTQAKKRPREKVEGQENSPPRRVRFEF